MLAGARRSFIDASRPARRLLARAEVGCARRWGWTIVSRALSTDVIVLETTGRRSGRARSTVLSALDLADGRLLVSGGAIGQTRTPDWVANVRAGGPVRVLGPAGARPVRVLEPTGEEREQWRALALDTWPRAGRYEEWSGRPLPVFLLADRPLS
jgi:deazaflavin-dependent oxidoreductase (nitroreductase family)